MEKLLFHYEVIMSRLTTSYQGFWTEEPQFTHGTLLPSETGAFVRKITDTTVDCRLVLARRALIEIIKIQALNSAHQRRMSDAYYRLIEIDKSIEQTELEGVELQCHEQL